MMKIDAHRHKTNAEIEEEARRKKEWKQWSPELCSNTENMMMNHIRTKINAIQSKTAKNDLWIFLKDDNGCYAWVCL